jgi:hypothetical protein
MFKCYFCRSGPTEVRKEYYARPTIYDCAKCGRINIDPDFGPDIDNNTFTKEDGHIISICLRNQHETGTRYRKPLTEQYLRQMIKEYHPPDELEKLDIALTNLQRRSSFVAKQLAINLIADYPYYHYKADYELNSVLKLLHDEDLIKVTDPQNPYMDLHITTKGYQRLREIGKAKDSRQCFVAMWFSSEMKAVYEKAIKPGIEYIEEGEAEPRYKALRIDAKMHTNDINAEVIAEIRRSRFMVCDLTGYRGGVYFEAGFAYGLGLQVIYTCRGDWLESENLVDQNGKVINQLFDSKGKKIAVSKEGIHFDLEHRNRTAWSDDNLDLFK